MSVFDSYVKSNEESSKFMQRIKDSASQALEYAKSKASQLTSYSKLKLDTNKNTYGTIFMIVILVLIVLMITIYIIRQFTKRKSNCNNINASTSPTISSMQPSDLSTSGSSGEPNLLLRDYYVKSAYNCCASGQFENDWVDLCALNNVIKQGCRFLDFEIYDLNDIPVVAVSSTANYYEKGSYNYVTFDDAIATIQSNAFTGGNCPNPKDPLFIHLRIKSNHLSIYNDISTILTTRLDSKMLPNIFSYEFGGKNLGAVPLVELLGKVIVIVDKSNPLFEKTSLDEFVNIASNSVFLRNLTYSNVVYSNDMTDLINNNKKNMCICKPDLSKTASNYNVSSVMQYGVQFPLMCFQINDNNLQIYNALFNESGKAFILKPDALRYIPVKTIPPTESQMTYGYKEYQSNLYNFKL
jgi:Phosphatidylinositol-specific phospholipase C, Y domain